MRKTTLLAVLLVAALPVLALAAGSIKLDTTKRVEITDCLANGGDAGPSSHGTLLGGEYLLRVTDSDTFVCISDADAGRSCPSGGEKLPSGTVLKVSVSNGGQTFSCRSSAGTGDLILTRIE